MKELPRQSSTQQLYIAHDEYLGLLLRISDTLRRLLGRCFSHNARFRKGVPRGLYSRSALDRRKLPPLGCGTRSIYRHILHCMDRSVLSFARRSVPLFVGPKRSPGKAWNALRGPERGISNLAFAASMSEWLIEQPNGAEIFRSVYGALEKVGGDVVFKGVSSNHRYERGFCSISRAGC